METTNGAKRQLDMDSKVVKIITAGCINWQLFATALTPVMYQYGMFYSHWLQWDIRKALHLFVLMYNSSICPTDDDASCKSAVRLLAQKMAARHSKSQT